MKTYEFEVDGQKVRIEATRLRGTLWFHYSGKTYAIETEARKGKSGKASTGRAHPGQIQAPMPGKVTRVLTRVGAQVAAGAPLVVMEAMKMEYTLTSDVDGTVENLNCSVGSQVALHQLLVSVRCLDVGAGHEG